jgi:hypothetical protein
MSDSVMLTKGKAFAIRVVNLPLRRLRRINSYSSCFYKNSEGQLGIQNKMSCPIRENLQIALKIYPL